MSFNVGLLYFLIVRMGYGFRKVYHRGEAFSPCQMVEGYDIIDELAFIDDYLAKVVYAKFSTIKVLFFFKSFSEFFTI